MRVVARAPRYHAGANATTQDVDSIASLHTRHQAPIVSDVVERCSL